MFLTQLEEDEQKKLFLQLATIVMMAEGNASSTSSLIDVTIGKPNHTSVFWQSLNEKEALALGGYASECRFIQIEFNRLNTESDLRQLILDEIIDSNLQSILADEVKAVLTANSKDQSIKQQVINHIAQSDIDLINLDADSMKSLFLTLPQIKSEVLENTACTVIDESKATLNDKIKKIILFELIGAGFSDGYFDESEKHLFNKICQWLDIEKEYVEEFLELASSFFTLNNDITDLINE